MFSAVCALPSPASAEGCCPSLFGWFTGTTTQSDFSCTFMSAVRFMAFADRSWSVDQDVQEISRFSCMLFLGVRGFLDYAGPTVHSQLAWLPCCLPPTRNEVGILIYGLFAAQSPRPPMPLSMLQETSHDVPCKTRGQDGFATSFPVGLLHPLVGSRTGAILQRFSLSVAPRFRWECLTSRTVSSFPAPASSNPSCRFPAMGLPVRF